MKKLFSLFAALLIGGAVCLAEDVELTSGDVHFFKDPANYAILEIDWSKTHVVEFGANNKVKNDLGSIDEFNRSQGEDWVRDWPAVQASVLLSNTLKKFFFNKANKKGMHIVAPQQVWDAYNNGTLVGKNRTSTEKNYYLIDPATAQYKIVVHIDLVDMGNTGASIVFGGGLARKAGGAKIMGYIDCIDLRTNKSAAQFVINDTRGEGGWTQAIRLGNVIAQCLGVEVMKIIKKTK